MKDINFEKSNIIFIFPDQMGADRLSCYGGPAATPNMQKLADRGVLFKNCYSASPVCTPFRGILFSGQYPSETGVKDNGDRLNETPDLLPGILNKNGYCTSYVGKWHLSGEPHGNRWVPPTNRGGFQRFIGWESHHVDHYDGKIFYDTPDATEMPGHESDALTDIAINEIDDLAGISDVNDGAKPFAMFLAYQTPHPPCSPPGDYKKMYRDADTMIRPNIPSDPPWYLKPGWNADYSHAEFTRRYLAEISHIDACIGRVVDHLEESGLLENTIVVLTSDHGEMCGSHGLFGKGIMREEALHVPLIVSHPHQSESRRGTHAQELFSTIDFYPTLLSMCGIRVSSSHSEENWHGMDYSGLIAGEEDTISRDIFYGEYKDLCIQQKKLRLTVQDEEPVSLFDLDKDPYETCNILDDPEYQNAKTEMYEKLMNWQRSMQGVKTISSS